MNKNNKKNNQGELVKFGFANVYVSKNTEYPKGSGLYGYKAVEAISKNSTFKDYKTYILKEDHGYSLYIENKYFVDNLKNQVKNIINDFEISKIKLHEKYLEELKKIEDDQSLYIFKLKELEEGDNITHETITRSN